MFWPGFFGISVPTGIEPAPLDFTGRFYSFLDNRREFAQATVAELLILNAWYFDVDVDAVQQWAGDAFLVFGDGSG
jgi:hypothetical protein